MKQKLFGAAALVAFILFGASCANQEQSEFNMDSVKQQVTISATVTYSTGVDVNATSYSIVNSKPAAGRRVFIEVPYAQYSNAAATGNKIFETVTDETGKFTITIPTKSTGITGTIRMEEFTDVYRTYEKMGADGKPVFKTELRNYSFTLALPANSLKPGGFKFPEEIVYASEKIDVDQFSNQVTMKGQVNLAYETGFRKGAFKAANKAVVEFTIIYNAGDPTKKFELKFGTTTDAQGNYSISLPVQSLADGFNIKEINVLGIGDNQFTHYDTDSTSVKVYGAYQLMNFGNTAGANGLAFANIIDGVTYNLGSQNLLFTPYYNAGVTDAANAKPDNWDEKLVGWAAGMAGFDESFSKTATVTGKVYMPYLSSFGEGAYRNEPQTVVLTAAAPYDNGLTVITDAQGNFSVDIPVKDDTPIAFALALEEEVQPFEFIDSKGTKTILRKGKYDSKTQIKKEGAQWYELGDFFFKYAPDGDEKPDEYNENLIGWYRSAEFDKPVEVKGNILFAVETSYGIGEYQPQTCIVEITTDDATPRKFAIKTKSSGAFDFMIPLKDEHDQPTLSITSAEYKTNEYVHYPKYNDDATQLLDVKYTKKATAYLTKEDKAAWNNLGTTYMYVKSTDVKHTPDTYNDDLAGWFIKTSEDVLYQESIKASGKAYMAVETDFLTGEYKAAKGQLIKLSVYGTTVSVLANNSGSFQFNVPLKNVGDETSIDIAAGDPIKVEDFKHYVDATGKYNIIEGEYTGKKIKPSDAQWNDLGTVYYTFLPKGYDGSKPEFAAWKNYFQYIAGWVYVDGRFVREVNVTGTVKIAEESAFRVGSYEVAKKFPVKIQIGTTYYVAATDNEGSFSIPVWQKFSGDEEEVNWVSENIKTEDLNTKFKHFRKAGTETVELLEAIYKEEATQETPGSAWYIKGTRFYSVKEVTDGTDFTRDLAGWKVWPMDAKTTLTIKGYVHQAYEKKEAGDYVPGWEASPNRLITVTAGTFGSFKVATSSTGAFSFTVKTVDSEGPADMAISVALDKELKSSSFTHYTNPSSAASKKTLTGKYVYSGNITSNITKSGTNVYNVAEPSFKLTFTPDGGYDTDPEWTQYDWASKTDVDK